MHALHDQPAAAMVSLADGGVRLTLLSEIGASVATIELDTGDAGQLARELLIAAEWVRGGRVV